MLLNLYNILLESLDYETLINEGKDPVEILHYKFQHIPSNIIDAVIAIDPTKKKSYSQWLLSKWDDESDIIEKNLDNGRLEKLFKHYKTHDEIQIKDCPSVKEGLDMFVPEEDTVLGKSSEPTTYIVNQDREVDSDLANDFDIVFDEENWVIAVPHTYEAAGKLGENTNWCTTGCYGDDSYYHHYKDEKGGEYYVNFDKSQSETLNGKDYPYKRYQFHFESNQFMNSKDNPVSVENIGMPDSAFEFYKSIDEDYEFVTDEEKMERYDSARFESGIKLNDTLYILQPYDDNWEIREPDYVNGNWYVYDIDRDERDPICWDEVVPDKEQGVVYSLDDELFVLRKKYGSDNYMVISIGKNRWGNDSYEASDIIKYMETPNKDGIIGITKDTGYRSTSYNFATYIPGYENDAVSMEGIDLSEGFDMWVNDNVSSSDEREYFVEIDYGYHGLVSIGVDDGTVNWVIKRDTPINGEEYVSNNGVIQGKFSRYSVNYDDETEDEENFILNKDLADGNYMVEHYNDANKLVFNILNGKTRKLLFDFWFNKLEFMTEKVYCVSVNQNWMLLSKNGQVLANDNYFIIRPLTKDFNILVCTTKDNSNRDRCDLFDENTGKIILQTRCITRPFHPIDGKIGVFVDYSNEGFYAPKIFDCVNMKFVYPQSKSDQCTETGLAILDMRENHGSYIIVNIETDEVVKDGITEVKTSHIPMGVMIKTQEGKVNCLSSEGYFYAPEDVDMFIFGGEYLVEYLNNGKYYFYNPVKKEFLFRPDGVNTYGHKHMYGTINFVTPDNEYTVAYKIDGKYFVYRGGSHIEGDMTYGYPRPQAVDENAPVEVKNFVNYLTGQGDKNMEAVHENFKRLFNRIMETRKRNL